MKPLTTLLLLLLYAVIGFSQMRSSAAHVVTVYSENGKYYLKSTPFDSEYPSLHGTTTVYEAESGKAIYSLDRGFDSVRKDSNNLILSNDGQVIFFVIPFGADDERDGLKSISVYKEGKLHAGYALKEVTGCDLDKERCSLLYDNFDQIVDREKSRLGTANFSKVFKNGVSEEEKFLSDFPLFSSNNLVYLIDSKKNVHRFDLENAAFDTPEQFVNVFANLKPIARNNRVELQRFDVPMYLKVSLKGKKTMGHD